MAVTIRDARPDDVDQVVPWTRETWPDRDATDYLPRVFEVWARNDDDTRQTHVAETDGRVVGVNRVVLLSEYEAWLQGIRVHPDVRGEGIGSRLATSAFEWARARGATVARNMVFSWNVVGLGLSRSVGFEPVTAIRMAHPTPDPDADPAAAVTAEPDAAWAYWARSAARSELGGLAGHREEPWSVVELTRAHLHRSAEETWVGVVQRDGTRGVAARSREFEAEPDGPRRAEYGVAAWADTDACRSLFSAVSRDAGRRGVEEVRVYVPATVRVAADLAAAGVPYAEGSEFVLAADLTGID